MINVNIIQLAEEDLNIILNRCMRVLAILVISLGLSYPVEKDLNIIYNLSMRVLAILAISVGRSSPVEMDLVIIYNISMQVLVFLVINVTRKAGLKYHVTSKHESNDYICDIWAYQSKSKSFLNVSELLSHLVLFSATRETCIFAI